MDLENREIVKDAIFEKALEEVIFEGWHDKLVYDSCKSLNIPTEIGDIIFPNYVYDLIDEFHNFIDKKMLDNIDHIYLNNLKIREKIYYLIILRINILDKYKDILRKLISFSILPQNIIQASRKLWDIADIMWHHAGDNSTDHNYYTKRILLTTLYKSSILYWLNDNSENYIETQNFIKRRIETIMKIGKFKIFDNLPKRLKVLFNISK